MSRKCDVDGTPRTYYIRPLAIVVLLFVVAVAIWCLRSASNEGAPAATSTAIGREGDPDRPAIDATPIRVPAEGVGSHEGGSAAPEGNANRFDVTIEIHGRVIVTEPDGPDREKESGTFLPTFRSLADDERGERRRSIVGDRVIVTEGRFALHVPTGCDVEVGDLSLGERVALVDGSGFRVESGVEFVVRAHWSARRTDGRWLHVVDAQSRADLQGVTILHANRLRSLALAHPGDLSIYSTLAADKPSPLDVGPCLDDPALGNVVNTWIGAPGHAWASVRFVRGSFVDRVVELAPGADLEVRVEGESPWSSSPVSEQTSVRESSIGFVELDGTKWIVDLDDDESPKLRLRPHREANDSSSPIGLIVLETTLEPDAPTSIRGIAPGSYVVAIERESRGSDPVVVGSAEVELSSGSTTRVTIHCARPPKSPEPVPLSGTLYIPAQWGSVEASLSMEPVRKEGFGFSGHRSLELATSGSGASDLLRWDAGRVLPGRYLFECDDFHLQTIVDTGPHGRTDVEIRIAEPADAAVRVVDVSDGQPVVCSDQENLLSWNVSRPQESGAWSLGTASWNAVSRSYFLRAPAGDIEFSMRSGEYEFADPSHIVTLRPGPNEITLRARRSCGVILRLIDGEGLVSWDDRVQASTQVRSGDGSDAVTMFSLDPKRLRIRLRTAGSYEVTVPDLAGYRPIAPFTIEVPAGTFVEHAITLERSR
jgi:hypothetical protein